MKHISITFILIALVATQFSCAPGLPTPAQDSIQSIGQVEKLQGGVQSGPESSLANVDPKRFMYNNDAIHVFDNGKANVDFGYGLTFTLYNDTIGGGTSVGTDGTSLQAVLKLSEGGLRGHNPLGSITRVLIPNGVNILILGTYYFITYDPTEDVVWVYNFDGNVQYALPNGSYQALPAQTLLEVSNAQVVQLYSDIGFSTDDFDNLATQLNSPIEAAKEMAQSAPEIPGEIPVTGATNTPAATPEIPTITPTATQTSTPTPVPTLTPTPIPCYFARFVSDVTIPDGTVLNPGTSFTKTWRLKNEGSCVWDPRYQIVFVSGTSMSQIQIFPWTGGTVGYGSSVDLSVNLLAPSSPGNYQGNFMLRSPDGTFVGLRSENKAFWVRIVVNLPPNSPPAIPAIVSPQNNVSLYCGQSAALDWDIPSDDTGIADYEVALEKWPLSCGTWCSAFNSNSVLVASDSLDITHQLECDVPFRWQVRARDKDGAWSGWSEWTYFKVFSVVR